jgi:hypothetical protein
VETELRRGYSGTARRKGRQQTNRTYCHRATFLLYRLPEYFSDCFVEGKREEPGLGRRAALEKLDGRLWVGSASPIS